MRHLRLAAAAALSAALFATPALAAEARMYRDEARGFTTMIPEGWTDPAGSATTFSPDGAVSCTISVLPNPRTLGKDQADINASLSVYTNEVWKTQFFTGGATGQIDTSGITKLEQFDAPWARGTITYPGRALAKFGVLMIHSPGKVASVTCTGEPPSYDKHVAGIGWVLNYLRPL